MSLIGDPVEVTEGEMEVVGEAEGVTAGCPPGDRDPDAPGCIVGLVSEHPRPVATIKGAAAINGTDKIGLANALRNITRCSSMHQQSSSTFFNDDRVGIALVAFATILPRMANQKLRRPRTVSQHLFLFIRVIPVRSSTLPTLSPRRRYSEIPLVPVPPTPIR
jgi:hypothetical protein